MEERMIFVILQSCHQLVLFQDLVNIQRLFDLIRSRKEISKELNFFEAGKVADLFQVDSHSTSSGDSVLYKVLCTPSPFSSLLIS